MAGGTDVLGRVDEAVIFTPQQLADAAPAIILFALCGYSLDSAADEAQTAMRRLGSQWAAVPAVRWGALGNVQAWLLVVAAEKSSVQRCCFW